MKTLVCLVVISLSLYAGDKDDRDRDRDDYGYRHPSIPESNTANAIIMLVGLVGFVLLFRKRDK